MDGRFKNPHGATAPRNASPGPQGYASGGGAAPVRISHGFLSTLPGRSRIFFQRQYFASYPRPLQVSGTSPFPRAIKVMSIKAPNRQAIVIREVTFKAYQHSGIGVEDLAEVPKGRAVGTLGFRFNLANRGLVDFQTNLPGRGVPVDFGQQKGGGASAPRAGQGNTYQGTGTITPNMPGQNFAAYAIPSSIIEASAVIFRPPSFDLRTFEVTVSGWLSDDYELSKIIDHLSK